MDNNDNYFPSINWDYFYYIGPGVAVALMLCMLASYCCQYCSRKNRGYTDSYHTSTTQTRQRRSNVTQGQRGNSSANRPAVADPFVYHQFVPWNSPRRSNQQTLNGNQTANYNYPPSTNPHFAAQTDAPVINSLFRTLTKSVCVYSCMCVRGCGHRCRCVTFICLYSKRSSYAYRVTHLDKSKRHLMTPDFT